jgi:hypothetical protein
MKSPRKKPLKFVMAMFENDSCPPVRCYSAIVHMIPLYFMGANIFNFPIFQLKSLGPADFAHPLRQSTPQPVTDDKEEVHSSGNKEEMAADVEDSAYTGRAKVATKKQGGSGKSRGGGRRSIDSRRFEAQRRTELEMPSENTATINLPKSR